MINPIKALGRRIEEHMDEHPLLYGFATLYVGVALAVNTLFYGVTAAQEGIERACGVKPAHVIATLKKKDLARGPNGEKIHYGVFQIKDDGERTILDYPVVTRGKLLPGTLEGMSAGKTYDLEVFGSPKWAQRLVDAKPVSR